MQPSGHMGCVSCLQDMMVDILDFPTFADRILIQSRKRCCQVQIL